MRAETDRRSRGAAKPPGLTDLNDVCKAIVGLLLESARFVAPDQVEALARSWLPRAEPARPDPAREVLQLAEAFGVAMDLALFTPSASGATAFDRLARARIRRLFVLMIFRSWP